MQGSAQTHLVVGEHQRVVRRRWPGGLSLMVGVENWEGVLHLAESTQRVLHGPQKDVPRLCSERCAVLRVPFRLDQSESRYAFRT